MSLNRRRYVEHELQKFVSKHCKGTSMRFVYFTQTICSCCSIPPVSCLMSNFAWQSYLFIHSCIDEIVLDYLVSILEHLGSGEATEEDFDVDDFCQMMQAYLPEFDVSDR